MNDYPYIGIWGYMLGSMQYYIQDEKQRARADKAPHNAISRRDDGTWSTTDDVVGWDTRYRISQECKHTGIPDPYASNVAQKGQ